MVFRAVLGLLATTTAFATALLVATSPGYAQAGLVGAPISIGVKLVAHTKGR